MKTVCFIISTDCIAPFTIDVRFDQYSDAGTANPAAVTNAVNTLTSCGKDTLIRCKIYSKKYTF